MAFVGNFSVFVTWLRKIENLKLGTIFQQIQKFCKYITFLKFSLKKCTIEHKMLKILHNANTLLLYKIFNFVSIQGAAPGPIARGCVIAFKCQTSPLRKNHGIATRIHT